MFDNKYVPCSQKKLFTPIIVKHIKFRAFIAIVLKKLSKKEGKKLIIPMQCKLRINF